MLKVWIQATERPGVSLETEGGEIKKRSLRGTETIQKGFRVMFCLLHVYNCLLRLRLPPKKVMGIGVGVELIKECFTNSKLRQIN